MKRISTLIPVFLLIFSSTVFSQTKVPSSYSNIVLKDGKYVLMHPDGRVLNEAAYEVEADINLVNARPIGTDEGLRFDFGKKVNGFLYYGLIDRETARYPQKVFFKKMLKVVDGLAELNISSGLSGKYDLVDWELSGRLSLGYRLLNDEGQILFDSRVNVSGTGPFSVEPTIISGPGVFKMNAESASITLRTDVPSSLHIYVNGQDLFSGPNLLHHEIEIKGLMPQTEYEYTVELGDFTETYSFVTSPAAGSRQAFSFAYASDSRAGKGGGERDVYGANAYIMKKIAALASYRGASFIQFTGDLVNGYTPDVDELRLQYHNWYSSIEAFSHYLPIWISAGNHEVSEMAFDLGDRKQARVDRFPFETHSLEALFAEFVTNPLNGPESEDGSVWDPDPEKTDFPSYKEGSYFYTYDNVAVISINSNYWYASSESMIPVTGGNPHAYIMDNQLQWIKESVETFERDETIDHIFISLHTPVFPNGGHSDDDMWYSGNNEIRPWIGGKAVDKGIIERRDEFLDILINQSKKTRAILCGDEHNYSRMRITESTPRYPENWEGSKLSLSRDLWQITNGSAGAPYYGQEELPWSSFVENFTVQYALVFVHIDGQHISVEVINPDTLEIIENYTLQ